MILITGGAWQGKRAYADAHYPKRTQIVNGQTAEPAQLLQAERIDNLHLWIRRMCEQGGDVYAFCEQLIKENPSVIVTMDEIGSGVIPIDAFELSYREACGRIGCLLAAQSTKVIRVFCGIGKEIKG